MYYEQDPRKKKQHPKRPDPFLERPAKTPKRRRGCLPRLLQLAFVLAVLCAAFLLLSGLLIRTNFFSGARPDLAAYAKTPAGYTHILLLGADAGEKDGGLGRSDSIMVASFGDGLDLKLTSLMRDTVLYMGERGEHKANAAYRLGGGELAMWTVNNAFALNITKYAAIDFQGIAQVIDAMGGIELSISKAERDAINVGLKQAYQKKRVINGVKMAPLTEYGERTHMSGTHALVYARIRKIDSDFARATRQRHLLTRMLEKIKANPNPVTLAKVASAALACVTTNLSPADLAALGVRALSLNEQIRQYRLPQDGAYRQTTEGGVWMIRPDLKQCRKGLYAFLFG